MAFEQYSYASLGDSKSSDPGPSSRNIFRKYIILCGVFLLGITSLVVLYARDVWPAHLQHGLSLSFTNTTTNVTHVKPKKVVAQNFESLPPLSLGETTPQQPGGEFNDRLEGFGIDDPPVIDYTRSWDSGKYNWTYSVVIPTFVSNHPSHPIVGSPALQACLTVFGIRLIICT